MKLIGDLKKQVNNAKDISEKRSIIEKAGMKLSYEELNMVAGGCCSSFIPCSEDDKDYDKLLNCPVCEINTKVQAVESVRHKVLKKALLHMVIIILIHALFKTYDVTYT